MGARVGEVEGGGGIASEASNTDTDGDLTHERSGEGGGGGGMQNTIISAPKGRHLGAKTPDPTIETCSPCLSSYTLITVFAPRPLQQGFRTINGRCFSRHPIVVFRDLTPFRCVFRAAIELVKR
jgi:hypothetical protein